MFSGNSKIVRYKKGLSEKNVSIHKYNFACLGMPTLPDEEPEAQNTSYYTCTNSKVILCVGYSKQKKDTFV